MLAETPFVQFSERADLGALLLEFRETGVFVSGARGSVAASIPTFAAHSKWREHAAPEAPGAISRC